MRGFKERVKIKKTLTSELLTNLMKLEQLSVFIFKSKETVFRLPLAKVLELIRNAQAAQRMNYAALTDTKILTSIW